MNKAEVDGKYLRRGKTMQSLKWFLFIALALVGAVKNSIGQMKCSEKLSHVSRDRFSILRFLCVGSTCNLGRKKHFYEQCGKRSNYVALL